MNQKDTRKKLICELVDDKLYVPMKEKELAVFLQVSREDREALKEVLEELLAEGKLELTKRGRYKKPEETYVNGTFIGNQKGFGFLEVEGCAEDLFIPESRVGGAFPGDTVQARVLPGRRGKRQEAEVVKVLERNMRQIVGTFQNHGSFGFVLPDDIRIISDVFVPGERSKGAVNGQKVVVEITDYGAPGKNPEGIVTEILGHAEDPGVDILSVIKAYDLPVEFPERVLNQAGRANHPVSEADMAGRLDLRDLDMVTIDGEDAKDLDDAVSLTMEGDLYCLGVHIADVANYVQENSALDREAVKRGTSVYLVDRVIPMLPHALSNGICSLNAGEDRLALSCIMKINGKGQVLDYQITETVIHVNKRMSYTVVNKILEEKDPELRNMYEELVPMFERMETLAAILREKRKQRGSIDFDFPETKIILSPQGDPVEIRPYDRNTATKLIEDFMLIANETVAQHFHWQEIPFVYRTHDNPDPEKIEKLGAFIRNFGYSIKMTQDEIHPKELQKLLSRIMDTPQEALISRLTLRSMKQARYTTENTGHFGLASSFYCHFTSPIRRYPDLQIHRIIKEQIRGRLGAERIAHYEAILPQVAKNSSRMERQADEAERETEKLKKVQFMESHIGEIFEGVISGITGWGIYVELENTIEGMIRADDLPGDFFYYDEEHYEMAGESTGKRYKLGERLAVQVKGADRMRRTIDFCIPQEA
ncbi:MAG: ribonuclease R [Lachnospiraceae bacterium]|jgi:ribonuclease R|nr:ribonuclease R [Lachnospiraceae bacterium]